MNVLGAIVGVWAFALIHVGAPLATEPVHLLAGAALAAVFTLAMVATLLPRPGASRAQPACPVVTPRELARRVRVPRQCDPDAAGHRRPRAPSVYPSVA